MWYVICYFFTLIFGLNLVLFKQANYQFTLKQNKVKKQNEQLDRENKILQVEHMYLHRADRVDKLLLLLKKYEPIQSHHFMSRYFQ